MSHINFENSRNLCMTGIIKFKFFPFFQGDVSFITFTQLDLICKFTFIDQIKISFWDVLWHVWDSVSVNVTNIFQQLMKIPEIPQWQKNKIFLLQCENNFTEVFATIFYILASRKMLYIILFLNTSLQLTVPFSKKVMDRKSFSKNIQP